MKKAYSKPEIAFESFTLSTNIAADCEIKTYTPAQGECAYDMGGMMVFTNGMVACQMQVTDGAEYKFCYHTPNPESNLFNS